MPDHGPLESLPSCAAGALGAEAANSVHEHLQDGCDVCESEFFQYAESAGRLPLTLSDVPLSPGMKNTLRSRIQSEFPVVPMPRRSPNYLAYAAVVLFAVFAGWIYWRHNSMVQSFESTLAGQRATITRHENALRSQGEEIRWLRDPAVQLALLTGRDPAPGARARLIWHPAKEQGVLYVQSVPALHADKSYQLWVIGNRGPVSAGVFEPDSRGGAVLRIRGLAAHPDGELQFAVTIEPLGGLPQPTGSMILAGKPL